MPERLYNEYYATPGIGNEISDKTATFINSILNEYSEYDLNDIQTVVLSTITCEIAVAKLTYGLKLRKARKAERLSQNGS